MQHPFIPFNKPYLTGRELSYVAEAHHLGQLAGDGSFTKKCHEWLEKQTGCAKVLLTHSCTAALEMAALLCDVKAGDEVIMPSFTFVSTANAFALRGAVPVFVDIRPDTLNINEQLIEAAITSKTRAIVPMHYAGISADMDTILAVARKHFLMVIEDAAQGVISSYRGKALGCLGQLGTFSFHETKNIISGEGGALLVNDPALIERAEIIREKGTNRTQFHRGQVDKYTWLDLGSSFLPGEVIAAFLYAQLQEAESITHKRRVLWQRYHEALEPFEREGKLRRPVVPEGCEPNAHLYYIILENENVRHQLIAWLREHNIMAIFHYVPLHSAPAGKRYGRTHGEMTHTDDLSLRLLRLPMWVGLDEHQSFIIKAIRDFFAK